MSSALPRFTGPAQARQRMRLIAALGMLAIAAITTGGLATLASTRPLPREQEPQPERASPKATNAIELPPLFDPARRLEAEVEDAERTVQRARARIRSERQRGVIDDRSLDELERRLDALGEASVGKPKGTRSRVPFDPQARAL